MEIGRKLKCKIKKFFLVLRSEFLIIKIAYHGSKYKKLAIYDFVNIVDFNTFEKKLKASYHKYEYEESVKKLEKRFNDFAAKNKECKIK